MTTQARLSKLFGSLGRFSSGQRRDLQAMSDDLYDIFTEITPETATATTGGGTTGLIAVDAQFVTVTSDSANKQVSLPAATVGKKFKMYIGANGCEVISAVAAHKVNNVIVGATNEAAIPASTLCTFEYVAANTWLMTALDNVGADVVIVPDTLV
jgi:hypothetical protein